jgi:hypothetical protein
MKSIFRQHPGILLATLLALFLISAEPVDLIRFEIINKSGMEIAVRLNGISYQCINKNDVSKSKFYYLPVPEGSKELPYAKIYTIERDTYAMQVFYLETYDPVYGFRCIQPPVNMLKATRNTRVVIGSCKYYPANAGEPSMRKYLPFPLSIPKKGSYTKLDCLMRYLFPHIKKYWFTRFIY